MPTSALSLSLDPYQCAETTTSQPALYRRPLPSTNLRFLNGIMWDGREPDLRTQAVNAALIYSQEHSRPRMRSSSKFSVSRAHHSPHSRRITWPETSAWKEQKAECRSSRRCLSPTERTRVPDLIRTYSALTNRANARGTNARWQQSIARGQMLFNTRSMRITAVPGFNDVQGQAQVMGTCSTCHNTPNVGGNSIFAMMNIGTGSPKADLPSYLMLCNDGTQVLTTDPAAPW